MGFLELMLMPIYIKIYIYVSARCGSQILVTNICDGGRISYILTNLIPNISALNSKHLLVIK